MSPRILLIEDDAILGELLVKKINEAGFEVTLVTDGGEGLAQMKQDIPDLVLLDILLPTMNGYEILEAKRDDASIKDIPVIIISNSGQPVELQRAIELGARDYFIKAQLDPDDILSKVQTILPSGSQREAPLTGKKILLVEDDKFLLDILSSKLLNEKFLLLHANTGEQVLAMASKEQPDVILLDLVLPGISGFDVLERLKANPNTKEIKVIILSNLSQEEDMKRAKELGASEFLIKAEHTPQDIFQKARSLVDETQQ